MPPLEALSHWTTDLVEAMRRKQGLGDALSAGTPGDHRAELRSPHRRPHTLLDAGKTDGTIREDAHPGDFLQLTGALRPAPKTGPRTCSHSSSTDSARTGR